MDIMKTYTNYQLYRTNIGLSGQLKWDIILSGNGRNIHISEFHLSPISHNIPFVYNQNDNLLNNSHADNVKNFFNITSSYFYKEILDSQFTNLNPNITDNNQYSNMYDMGCKRSKYFNLYNKQFEFLCPLWIEHITDSLSFVFTIKNFDNKKTLSTSKLCVSLNGIKYHDRFVEYLNDFIDNAGLRQGNDELINIDFKNNKTTIQGFNVKTGLFETKSINLIDELTTIERPLMNTDELILKQFEENNLISKQLFNFNLCFNLEDIIPKNILSMIYGKNVIISVAALIDEVELEKSDFYTNYEYIEKNSNNVLDYLYDYKYVDLISKNKFCQNICHWNLSDDPNYIFNVYKGFNEKSCTSYNDAIIQINKSLKYKIANSPSNESTEISYNTNNTPIVLSRPYGNIKPMFSMDNILYYKKYENDINNTTYTNKYFSKFEPVYPSINYCPIDKLDRYTYDIIPIEIHSDNEYTWFNDNKYFVLESNINVIGNFNSTDSIDSIVYNVISKHYNISDNKTISYIKNLYKYTNNWDYKSNTNIDNKIYNISLILK